MAIGLEFLVNSLLFFGRALVSSLICLFLGYLGIRSLDYMTTKITEFKDIKGDPIATGLFASGFFIFTGLVLYGCMNKPFFQSQSVLFGPYFNVEQFINVLLGFLVSLLFGWLFYFVFAKLTLFGIDLDDVNKSPVAVGAFLFGYEVFLGIIMYASITIPL